MSTVNERSAAICHKDETKSNDVRHRLVQTEPRGLRTFTPSLAVIQRSAGSYHWTPDGRKLADFTSGVLVANLGHHPSRWWRRVMDYLELNALDSTSEFLQAVPLTTYNATSSLEISCCERLLANLREQPGGQRMEKVLWAASGSEAIQKALWAVLAMRPQRDHILATRRGFHGKKGLASAVTGSEEDPDRDPRVRFLTFPTDDCGNVDRRREPLDLAPYRRELEALDQELGNSIGCLITEPYLGGGGSYHPQPEYLQLLQQFCRDRDCLFILDEIQSNFGRTGPMYAFTRYGLEPDIVCLGKGMGNGVPVSAAVGRADVLDALAYGEASDTWSANPLSSAAVLATLDEFAAHPVLDAGQALSAELERGLLRLRETGVVAHVRGEGCVWGVECGSVGDCSANEVANACVADCYLGDADGRAIHLLGPLAGRVLRVSPPLVMPLDEARDYLDVMFEIFQSLYNRLA